MRSFYQFCLQPLFSGAVAAIWLCQSAMAAAPDPTVSQFGREGGRNTVIQAQDLAVAANSAGRERTGKWTAHEGRPTAERVGTAAVVEELEGYKLDGYRMPVPQTLKGAKVIETPDAEKLYEDKSALFIDVYPQAPKPPNLPAGTVFRQPKHKSIAGSLWMPNVGYGVLSPKFETYFRESLEAVTQGDKGKAVVFFCLRNCWMSWNAAKRAMSWGYTNVIWYPDGSDGWKEFNNPIDVLKPLNSP